MMRRSQGFTLVELLVVIAIIGVLVALLLPAVQAARGAARRTECASKMRQIGLAIHQYADAHRGAFPLIVHGGRTEADSWLNKLAPYLESVDEIRLCPDDLERLESRANTQTSYAMNGYLREKEPIPAALPAPVKAAIAAKNEGLIDELFDCPRTHKTIVMFEGLASSLGTNIDHVHANDWFSALNLKSNVTTQAVWKDVTAEVAVERHTGGVANYLYADGHVEAISAEQISAWCAEGFNFAIPPE